MKGKLSPPSILPQEDLWQFTRLPAYRERNKINYNFEDCWRPRMLQVKSIKEYEGQVIGEVLAWVHLTVVLVGPWIQVQAAQWDLISSATDRIPSYLTHRIRNIIEKKGSEEATRTVSNKPKAINSTYSRLQRSVPPPRLERYNIGGFSVSYTYLVCAEDKWIMEDDNGLP